MATHCSILAWRIPRREETGGFHRTTESDRSEQLTHTQFESPRRDKILSGFQGLGEAF